MPSIHILKQYFAIRLYSATRFALFWLFPVEILLNNVEQNLQSGQLHHWATSAGTAEITTSLFAVIHSSCGISNPFRGIIQPFGEIVQPV